MAATIALGFSPHSGWATAVSLRLERRRPLVLQRVRLELCDPVLPGQVFHAAAALADLADAAALVEEVHSDVAVRTRKAVADLVAAHSSRTVVAAAVPSGSTEPPDDLATILGSHTLLHTAEGALYRDALADAAADAGLRVEQPPARDLLAHASAILGVDVRAALDGLRKDLGAPWTADHKSAAAAAWLALAGA